MIKETLNSKFVKLSLRYLRIRKILRWPIRSGSLFCFNIKINDSDYGIRFETDDKSLF